MGDWGDDSGPSFSDWDGNWSWGGGDDDVVRLDPFEVTGTRVVDDDDDNWSWIFGASDDEIDLWRFDDASASFWAVANGPHRTGDDYAKAQDALKKALEERDAKTRADARKEYQDELKKRAGEATQRSQSPGGSMGGGSSGGGSSSQQQQNPLNSIASMLGTLAQAFGLAKSPGASSTGTSTLNTTGLNTALPGNRAPAPTVASTLQQLGVVAPGPGNTLQLTTAGKVALGVAAAGVAFVAYKTFLR